MTIARNLALKVVQPGRIKTEATTGLETDSFTETDSFWHLPALIKHCKYKRLYLNRETEDKLNTGQDTTDRLLQPTCAPQKYVSALR